MGSYNTSGSGTFTMTLSNPDGWRTRQVRHKLTVQPLEFLSLPDRDIESNAKLPSATLTPTLMYSDPARDLRHTSAGDLSTRSDGSAASFESYESYESYDSSNCPGMDEVQLTPLLREQLTPSTFLGEDELLPMLQASEEFPASPGTSQDVAGGAFTGVHHIGDMPLHERMALGWRLCMGYVLRIVTVPCMVCCPGWDCWALRWLKNKVKTQNLDYDYSV